MSGHSQQPANHQNGSSYTTQEQADTHRSLQQASQALELASNRIRQVRRSLLQLSESLPSNESLARIGSYDDLRPAHDALVLTGADGVQRPTSVRADRRRLRNVIPLEGPAPSSHPGTSGESPARTISSSRTTVGSEADRLRSMYSADPSATTRGMRVAARQAMLQQGQNAPDGVAIGQLGEPLLVDTAEDFYASVQARYERLQRILRTGNLLNDFHRADGDEGSGPTSSTSIADRVTRRWGPLIPLNAEPIAPSTSLFMPSLPSLDAHPGGQPTAQNSSPDATASLSGTGAASITASTRPGSAEQRRLFLQDLLLSDYPIFNPDQRREQVDDDDSSSQMRGTAAPSARDSTGSNRRDDHTFQYYRSPSNMADMSQRSRSQTPSAGADSDASLTEERASRRAWARLDADGDEIPPNEEEELERQRTSYRIRAQQRARQHLAPGQVDSSRSFGQVDRPRDMHGSVIDSTRIVPDVRRQQPSPPVRSAVSGEVKDSYVDPLPMPLEAMVMTTDTQQEEDIFIDIVFPKNACIAGR